MDKKVAGPPGLQASLGLEKNRDERSSWVEMGGGRTPRPWAEEVLPLAVGDAVERDGVNLVQVRPDRAHHREQGTWSG